MKSIHPAWQRISGPLDGWSSGHGWHCAVFAGIHGDEPDGMDAVSELLGVAPPEGWRLSVFPCLNAKGFALRQREHPVHGDLNRLFWRNHSSATIRFLENFLHQDLDGLISLHTDLESYGFYGYARGKIISEEILRPCLDRVDKLVPINTGTVIDGFPAERGIIRDCFPGILSPKGSSNFEIILESPGLLPVSLRTQSHLAAIRAILFEYGILQAFAAGI